MYFFAFVSNHDAKTAATIARKYMQVVLNYKINARLINSNEF